MIAVHITDAEIDEILDSISQLDSARPMFKKTLKATIPFGRKLFGIYYSPDPLVYAEFQGSVELCLEESDRGCYYYHTLKRFKDKDDLRAWLKKAQAKGNRREGKKLSEPMRNVLWKQRWS